MCALRRPRASAAALRRVPLGNWPVRVRVRARALLCGVGRGVVPPAFRQRSLCAGASLAVGSEATECVPRVCACDASAKAAMNPDTASPRRPGPRVRVRSCPTLRRRCFPAAPSPVRAAHEPPGASVRAFMAPNQRSANRRRLRLPLAADASGRACGATSLALSREGCRFCPNPRVHSPPVLSHRTLPLPPVLLAVSCTSDFLCQTLLSDTNSSHLSLP